MNGRVLLVCGAREETDAWALARSLDHPIVGALESDRDEARAAPPRSQLFVGPRDHLRVQLTSAFSNPGVHIAVGVAVGLVIEPSCTVLVTGGAAKVRWRAAARAIHVDVEVADRREGVVARILERMQLMFGSALVD